MEDGESVDSLLNRSILLTHIETSVHNGIRSASLFILPNALVSLSASFDRHFFFFFQ